MKISPTLPIVEEILAPWGTVCGIDFEGYKNHVYRMIHVCLALRNCSDEEAKKIMIAACFHDIGLWSKKTVDYLPPSIDEAQHWLKKNDLSAWSDEISQMIDQHHKLSTWKEPGSPLIEVFRRGDLVDFSLGVIKFGIPSTSIQQLKIAFPNHGFHKMLIRGAFEWFSRHPLTLPPFMKK